MEELLAIQIAQLKFDERTGLIPVVAQEVDSREVLMVAFANREAVAKTLTLRYAHYWSRSRGRLWMKGETSSHTQKIVKVLVDCDYDTLLYLVKQKGPACHTGRKTCFNNVLT